MTTGSITHDSRRTHGGLSESARRPHSLKWKWSTEVESEVENFKSVMAEPVSNRRSADARVGDDLDLTIHEGEAR